MTWINQASSTNVVDYTGQPIWIVPDMYQIGYDYWQYPNGSGNIPSNQLPDLDDDDWIWEFDLVWTPDKCTIERHRLYHAIGADCPCRKLWEADRDRKIAEKIARRAEKQKQQEYIWTTTGNTGNYQYWADNTTTGNSPFVFGQLYGSSTGPRMQ